MNKIEVINELKNVVDILRNDKRNKIKGLKIMICEHNWDKRKSANDSNLFIDWEEENEDQ